MAEKKLKKQHFEILLEDIKGKISQIVEGHSAIRIEMGKMENRLKGEICIVNLAVNALGKRIDSAEDSIGKRIDSVENRLGGIEEKADKIDNKLDEHIKFHPGSGQINQPINV